MAAPIVVPLVRWFVTGFALSFGWKIGCHVFDRIAEDERVRSEADEIARGVRHTWTGRPVADRASTRGWCPVDDDNEKPHN